MGMGKKTDDGLDVVGETGQIIPDSFNKRVIYPTLVRGARKACPPE